MKINAKIKYKVKPTHPDLGDMPEHLWKGKVFTYDDKYTFDDDNWDEEGAKAYIRRDIALVAGGGYNAKHIYDVEYEMEVI